MSPAQRLALCLCLAAPRSARADPPRALAPALDLARPLVGAPRAARPDGVALTGRGVVVGMIDAGFDLAHPDLRRPDGRTRVAWMLDYARAPLGAHPDLERRYAVTTAEGPRGAVLSGDELDRALARGDAPGDATGHGTHALSVALGNGGPEGRYVGVAPEAAAVLVRAATSASRPEVLEALVRAGAGFVFDRADAAGAPAVLSLSLGTHRGAHDGDSALERELAALVRDGDAPGRAVVASAGNGGGRALHAAAVLARGETVPLTLRTGGSSTSAVGVAVASRAPFSLAVRWPDGAETTRVAHGDEARARHPRDGSTVHVANAREGPSPRTGARVAEVIVRGPAGDWGLLVRGEGRVDAWVFLDGDAAARGDAPRFLPPWGDESASVEMPATSPAVVSVGALATRAGWTDLRGRSVTREGVTLGAASTTSSRGPTASLALAPSLAAPGEVVVAALASGVRAGPLADPATHVDATHAAAWGSSAAAPLVAGAVALLFEAAPRATQRALLDALASGDAPWRPDTGWASLDVPRALAALAPAASSAPSAARSRCALPDALRVDEAAPVACRLVTDDGAAAAGALSLAVSAGRAGAFEALGGGRYAARCEAPSRSGEATLTVTLGGAVIARATVPVRPRRGAASAASGGCAARPGEGAGEGVGAWLVALVMAVAGRRLPARGQRALARVFSRTRSRATSTFSPAERAASWRL